MVIVTRRISAKQVHILDGMLTLHGRLVAPEMQPLHDRLVELFHIMKQGIKASVSHMIV